MYRKRKRNLCISAAKLTGDSTCLLLDKDIYIYILYVFLVIDR